MGRLTMELPGNQAEHPDEVVGRPMTSCLPFRSLDLAVDAFEEANGNLHNLDVLCTPEETAE
ncbi:MAG: hypothetical protein WBQ23_03180 [Bacteroidota bacterium]